MGACKTTWQPMSHNVLSPDWHRNKKMMWHESQREFDFELTS